MNAADQRCEMCGWILTEFPGGSIERHDSHNDHRFKPAIVEPVVNPIADPQPTSVDGETR